MSQEQQEYFKDSKVRDEKGNLKTVYHGSNGEGQYAKLSNLTSDNSMNYNNNESMGEESGRQGNQRNIRNIIESSNRRRSEGNTTKTTRKEITEGYDEKNISKESIEDTLTDLESKKKTINFAKKNKITKLNLKLQELNNIANELGINLTLYNGESGNNYIGLSYTSLLILFMI